MPSVMQPAALFLVGQEKCSHCRKKASISTDGAAGNLRTCGTGAAGSPPGRHDPLNFRSSRQHRGAAGEGGVVALQETMAGVDGADVQLGTAAPEAPSPSSGAGAEDYEGPQQRP